MKTLLPIALLITLFTTSVSSQNTLDNAGLTAATPSCVAFSLRKLSSTYTGSAIKVRRSSDNAEANINFDVSGDLTGTSVATFTAGVSVGTGFGVTQAGTISSSINKSGTLTIKAAKTGTITASSSTQIVSGVSTLFTSELTVGDRLFNGTNNVFLGIVASITNNTSLTLTNNSTISVGAITFKSGTSTVIGTGTNFTGELSIGERLFNVANTYLGTVTNIINGSTLMLNSFDAVSATAIIFKGTGTIISGVGTNFTSLTIGDMLISNGVTLGIISSISSATSLTLSGKAGAAVTTSAYKTTAGSTSFASFFAGNSVYVNVWYDQSGNGRDAIQPKPLNQARIVNAGLLYTVNGRTSMEFSNSLASFLQTSTTASYLNNSLYTLNKVTAEATINPALQLPISTTGGNGPNNTISHYGYRSSFQFTVAQYGNDQNFNATPSTSLELHTSVKTSTASSEFYKNGISLGVLSSGVPSNLNSVGLLNIGYYTPTNSFYNGSISELTVFSTALSGTDVALLNDNQLLYYNIATTYWTGAVSTDWNNTGNWSTGILPTLSNPSIVVISSGKPRYPLISATSIANSISLEAGTSLTITGILQIAGTINNLGTCAASSGTIQYVGPAPQSIVANTFVGNTVQNISINNATGVTANGSINISGNLTFTSGKLSIASSSLTLGGTVTNTISGGLSGGSNSILVMNGAVSPTLSFDQTIAGSTNALKTMTINSAGQIVTLGNNLVLLGTGTTTFASGKLAIGASTLTMRGAVVNTVSEGLRGGPSANLVVDGTISPTLSFDQTISGNTNNLNNLTLNCAGQIVSLNKELTVSSALTITTGQLADGGNQVTSSGTLNLISGILKLGAATVATTYPGFTSNNISTTGTVEYAAGVPQIISGTPVYQNLTISAIGGGIAANNLAVNNILKLSAANPSATVGTLATNTFTLNMGPASTTIGIGDVTGIVKRTTILANVNYTMGNEFSSITFPNVGTLPSQMSMKISIGITPSWQVGGVKRTYEFIQTGGVGTKAVINAHYLDGELNGNIENKLVDFSFRFSGSILTEHGKSNFSTVDNWIALSNVNVAFFSSAFGNVELGFDESALTTLTWNGSTSTSWITATNWTPNGGPSTNTILIVPDASTTPNDPYIPATASNGSLTIEAGGIVNSDPGAILTLNNSGLVWSCNGSFIPGSSTVIFTNAGATMNGITNFNNISINSGASLLMTTGTVMRVGGLLVNNGTWNPGLLSNTVEYTGNNQNVVIPNGSGLAYQNLIVGGTGISQLPAGNLNVLGNLTINGTISTSGNTVGMNGSVPQSINSSVSLTLNNLTINNSASSVNLNQDLIVNNMMTFTLGKMSLNNHRLTLSGSLTNSVANGLIGSMNSDLYINGTTSPVISFDQSTPGLSNALRDLVISSNTQTILLGSDLEVNGGLNFLAGKLGINGNTLTLKGTVTNTFAGALQGSSTSNLLFAGGVSSPSISFDQSSPGTTNLLNSLSLASPAQAITIANPLIINGSIALDNGIIFTSSLNNLTLTSNATVTGGSDFSYVDGPLIRKTNSAGQYQLPIGKTNSYRPIRVQPVSSTPGEYQAEYIPLTVPGGSLGTGVSAVSTNEYWNISTILGPDAVITLIDNGTNTWSNGNPTSMDNIFVTKLNSTTWDAVYGDVIAGNASLGDNPIRTKVITANSSFTFGFGPNVILPISLIDFKAVIEDLENKLTWTTANEVDFEKFELERSGEGQHFLKIATVVSTKGNGVKIYNWNDNQPLPYISYYRLKMIDIDGHFKYSYIIRIDRTTKKQISIYPNPVVNHVLLLQTYGQPKGNYVMTIYGFNGAIAMTTRFVHDGNDGVRSISLGNGMTEGVYYIEVIDPEKKRNVFTILVGK